MAHRIVIHIDTEHKAAKSFFEEYGVRIRAEDEIIQFPLKTRSTVYYVEGWRDELEPLLREFIGWGIEITPHEIDAKTLTKQFNF